MIAWLVPDSAKKAEIAIQIRNTAKAFAELVN